MQIVEFSGGTLRFLEQLPEAPPRDGFVWVFAERETLRGDLAPLQAGLRRLGGTTLLDVHLTDLLNASHPSGYDYTSAYDLITFRRLATEDEMKAEPPAAAGASALAAFGRLSTRAVGFVVFDRLLLTVHPAGCFTAKTFIQRYLADALHSEGLSAAARNRLPTSPADLMLRMVNLMVDSYLELRQVLSAELDQWQAQLLAPRSRGADWASLMAARRALHHLEDLCEGQNDAMQEWLDTQREQPSAGIPEADREGLLARARDVIEHIERVVHHARRMEQGAESAVQIHFSAQSHRTNEIMRVLTALTAVFLPLNFITGFFGMNFEFLPLIHSAHAMWAILGTMIGVALLVTAIFWRKRYLARTR